MFIFALFIGIYSYGIFALGILSLLTKINIFLFTFLWFISLIYIMRKSLRDEFKKLRMVYVRFKKHSYHLFFLLLFLFVLQTAINLIGALGPELAFDALWYHLSLPKLYLLYHTIYHIPGGLLYYSDMPKLGELLYVGMLSLSNEIGAKILHFIFGLLICISLYKFSNKFFTQTISLLVAVIFYSNLVVDWESITAYIDLIRTFFEILCLWSFILWTETQFMKWLVLAAVMMGLAITTKILAIGSLFIFVICIFIARDHTRIGSTSFIFTSLFFILIAFLIPFPWFIFSLIHTGNPFYPFFSHIYTVNPTSPNPLSFIISLWNLFTHASDPISPLYLLFFPLLFITAPHFKKEIKLILWYCGLSLILWYFTPQTGGGRFILPYLPAFSFICGAIYSEILKLTRVKNEYISKLLLVVVIFVSLLSIIYRGVANTKYIPVIIGKESQRTFLANHLNFSFGDFYDTDNYFADHIKPNESVLLYGFHNLYYVNFPFVDSSWVKKGDRFNYIATQNTKVPEKFKNWQRIYLNDKTMVQLYRPPKGECHTVCYY